VCAITTNCVAFFFHPNNISMANNDTYTLLRAFNPTDGTNAFDTEYLKNGSGQQQVRGCRFRLLQDGSPGTLRFRSGFTPRALPEGQAWVSTAAVNIALGSVHTIKVEWRASSGTITNGGINACSP
jgi:hypothetical protein